MQTINITEFKAKALKMIDAIYQTKKGVVITRRGKPLAKIIPFQEEPEALRAGKMADTVISESDILAPIDDEWEAGS